jgi:hypothetical protein
MASQIRTLKTQKGMEVKTNLTDEEAMHVLRDVPGSFAADLLSKAARWGLSPDQMAWAHKLAIEHLARKAGLIKVRSYKNIAIRLRAMLSTSEFPKLSTGKGATAVAVSLAGPRSKYTGDVMISDLGRYPNNRFFGRLDGNTGEYFGNAPDFVHESLAALDRVCGVADSPAAAPVKARRTRKPKTAARVLDEARDEAIRPGTDRDLEERYAAGDLADIPPPLGPVEMPDDETVQFRPRRSRKSTKPAAVKLDMTEDELEAADEERWAKMNGSAYRDRYGAN